jgi:hypothetical protein
VPTIKNGGGKLRPLAYDDSGLGMGVRLRLLARMLKSGSGAFYNKINIFLLIIVFNANLILINFLYKFYFIFNLFSKFFLFNFLFIV